MLNNYYWFLTQLQLYTLGCFWCSLKPLTINRGVIHGITEKSNILKNGASIFSIMIDHTLLFIFVWWLMSNTVSADSSGDRWCVPHAERHYYLLLGTTAAVVLITHGRLDLYHDWQQNVAYCHKLKSEYTKKSL